jgi:hypothetical protein
MAFLGAGSASATVFCSETPTPNGACPPGKDYPAGTIIHAETEGTTIYETLSGTVLDTCEETFKDSTTNTGGANETVTATIEELHWTNCTKVTVTLSKDHMEFHAEENHNATVTLHNTSWTINTIFGSCIYGTGATLDVGTLTHSGTGAGGTGNEHATIDANSFIFKVGGNAACPAEIRQTAQYTVTAPKPLYIATSAE